jgi:hypothetical protein
MVISEGMSNAEVGHICRCEGNSKKRIVAFISHLKKNNKYKNSGR